MHVLKRMAAIKNLPRQKILLIAIIAVFAILGTYLLFRAFAAGSFVATEAESSLQDKGALTKSDSTASGGKSVRFSSGTFSSALKQSSTTVSLLKNGYGAITPLTNKGYTKMNILQVADASGGTALDPCPIGAADSRLKFQDVYCDPYESSGWRHQGITGVGGSGYSNRNDVILLSWHHVDDVRSRLSVINTTTKKRIFVEFVRPCNNSAGYCEMGVSSGGCGGAHAGGLAWYKSTLFVADTSCIEVFDINTVYKVSSNTYVMPTTMYWKNEDAAGGVMAPHFIGIDLFGQTPRVLVGEYLATGCAESHIGSYDIDPTTENIKLDSGSSTRATTDTLLYGTGRCAIQGIAYYNGMYLLSTSGGGTDYAYRYRVFAGAPADTSFLEPPNTSQGLYIDPTRGLTWADTETAGTDGNCRFYNFTTASAFE